MLVFKTGAGPLLPTGRVESFTRVTLDLAKADVKRGRMVTITGDLASGSDDGRNWNTDYNVDESAALKNSLSFCVPGVDAFTKDLFGWVAENETERLAQVQQLLVILAAGGYADPMEVMIRNTACFLVSKLDGSVARLNRPWNVCEAGPYNWRLKIPTRRDMWLWDVEVRPHMEFAVGTGDRVCLKLGWERRQYLGQHPPPPLGVLEPPGLASYDEVWSELLDCLVWEGDGN